MVVVMVSSNQQIFLFNNIAFVRRAKMNELVVFVVVVFVVDVLIKRYLFSNRPRLLLHLARGGELDKWLDKCNPLSNSMLEQQDSYFRGDDRNETNRLASRLNIRSTCSFNLNRDSCYDLKANRRRTQGNIKRILSNTKNR